MKVFEESSQGKVRENQDDCAARSRASKNKDSANSDLGVIKEQHRRDGFYCGLKGINL